MSAEDQLRYVYRYLQPYTGRLASLADLYMAILWPAAIGKASDYVLFDERRHPKAYAQNAGLDADDSSTVTKAEPSPACSASSTAASARETSGAAK